MFNLQQVAERRTYLLGIFSESEAAIKNPRSLPKQREAARKVLMVVGCAIEELELILGLRQATTIDLCDGQTR